MGIAPIGLPLRRISDTVITTAELAPPVDKYVMYSGFALFDDRTGDERRGREATRGPPTARVSIRQLNLTFSFLSHHKSFFTFLQAILGCRLAIGATRACS